MREIPPCLNRRYQALDKLISELTQQHMSCMDSQCSHDPEIKLLCDFWNILKEDPDCDLPRAIHCRMCTESDCGSVFGTQRFSCYMATTDENPSQPPQPPPPPPPPPPPQDNEPPNESRPKESKRDNEPPKESKPKANEPPKESKPKGPRIDNEPPKESKPRESKRDNEPPNESKPRESRRDNEPPIESKPRESKRDNEPPNETKPRESRRDNEPPNESKPRESRRDNEPRKASKPKESRHDEAQNEGDIKCCTSSRDNNPMLNEDDMPLSKVLCSLKEAASFDKRCHVRLNNLIESEKRLQEQIKYLEAKEKQGVEMLQQADCIWSCMEESYKQKIQESLERQKFLLKQLKDVENSTTKWRKNKKELESQLQSVGKCQEEIKEKINQKTNDIKTINKEIEDFKKRIHSHKKDSENSKKSLKGKKHVSDGKLACLAKQIKNLQEELKKEQMFKEDKEAEGNLYISDAREDLQRICKLLLMKKLEHEDLKAEKQALMLEINLLKDSCDQCKERCHTKQSTLNNEITRIENEIENYRAKCIQCHQCVDTSDVRKFCGECPRCQEERDCIYQDEHCIHDDTTDCVCQVVKAKFLDNVFDNMYTVLERQAKTGPGKAVAEAVLDCLRRSRNGKLNPETRKILQEFILSTVKKNLNLTIVGGAVKTRCELEPQMYEKLMACLKDIKPTRVPKADAGTDVKGDPCKRWGGPRECHCNKGPNACICNKKAPPPPKEPGPCPINKDDEEDRCPFHKDNICGPECSTRSKGRGPCGGLPDPEDLGDLGQYIPDSCQGPSCPYTKDMRAAQCVFGPEPISSTPSFKTALTSYEPGLDSQVICKCGGFPVKPCPCQDSKQLKAILAQNPTLKSCWKEWNDDPHSSSGTPSFLKDDRTVQVKIKRVPSVLTDFITKSQEHSGIGTEPLVEYRDSKKKAKNLKKSEKKKQSNEKLEAYLTELKNTCSGDLFIELDHEIISKIRNKANQNTNLFVSIRETNSGNYLIDFDSADGAFNDSGKNILKQSCSGTMFLEVDKDIVSNIYPYLRTNHSKSSVSIGILQKKLPCDCLEEQLAQKKAKPIVAVNKEKIDNKTKNEQNKTEELKRSDLNKTKRTKSVDDFRAELKYNLGSQKPNMTLKIQGENGVSGVTKALVIETPSGNIALRVKKEDLESIGHIAANNKEIPVCLKKLFNDYTLYLQNKSLTKAPNTVLRRTISGEFLVVITEPVLSNAHPKELPECNIHEKIFKIKVKGTKNNSIIEPPAILKLTSSENYMLVLDKEFENEHRSSLNNFSNQCFVELKKTDSHSILINFDDSESIHNKQNALLIRSNSGNMKILVNGPVFDNLSLTKSNKSSAAVQDIEKVLFQSNVSCKHKRQNQHPERLADVKSSSDSTLYGKQNNQSRNIDLSTATLKRTDSGKYAILLQNNAKKHFINNLKSYLSTKHQGHVPIWKGTESGEITIDLSSHGNKNQQCGSLKITPSGNIFIIVDETFIKNVSSNMENIDRKSPTGSSQQYKMNNDFDFSPNGSSSLKGTLHKTDVKSSSHCDLYEKAKSRLQNQKGLLDGSAATVRKTDSGHYLVILNKESKKALINDLRSCLNTQDRIQFWKGSESGGIKIDLKSNKNKKDNCGSLKISNSGNIYVVVNEKQLKNITKDIESNESLTSVADIVLKNVFSCSPRKTSFADSKCNYLIKTVKNIDHKQTATHCKGKPDDVFCKRSKCVCSENKNLSNECEKTGTSTDIQKLPKTTPHIVIQPCGCQSSKQKHKSNNQCFYVIDSVCPLHKNRYDNVSNELLEISGTCKKTKHAKVKGKAKKQSKPKKWINVSDEQNTEDNLYWDSLSFLPPQLPPFLRNFQTA